MSDERWSAQRNRRGARHECTERRCTFGKTAESSPSALRCHSEIQLPIDLRKLIERRASGLAAFLIELDQIGK